MTEVILFILSRRESVDIVMAGDRRCLEIVKCYHDRLEIV